MVRGEVVEQFVGKYFNIHSPNLELELKLFAAEVTGRIPPDKEELVWQEIGGALAPLDEVTDDETREASLEEIAGYVPKLGEVLKRNGITGIDPGKLLAAIFLYSIFAGDSKDNE